MDLKIQISENLWAAIETSYVSSNYTIAILDALYFLSDFIREKTGLQSDGVALIGQAFGGKSPKLRVNQLQTESELDIQKGTANLLMGLYQSVRNPRSHTKLVDSKEDADSIILFVNYLLKIIGVSKGTFSKNEFLGRVFDSSFVKKQRYAELLVDDIPARHRLDIMIDVYRRKDEGKVPLLNLFATELLKKLSNEEKTKFKEVVCDELKSAEKESIYRSVGIFPIEFWLSLDEPVRLRSENVILNSVIEGRYIVESKKCVSGAIGTWGADLMHESLIKYDYILALMRKLKSSDIAEQDYVFQYYGVPLLEELNETKDSYLVSNLIELIDEKVKEGNKRFYQFAQNAINVFDGFWEEKLKQSVADFQEVEETPSENSEDIPF